MYQLPEERLKQAVLGQFDMCPPPSEDVPPPIEDLAEKLRQVQRDLDTISDSILHAQLPVASSPSEMSLRGMTCYEAPGTINGVPVNALPDTGSSVDAMSEDFALLHG